MGEIGSRQDENKKENGVFSHAGAYASVEGFKLVSACEPDSDRALTFRRFWGVDAIYTDIEVFLSQCDLDVISICTPDETHYPVLKKVLSNSRRIRAVIVEKPVAMTYRECQELEETAARSGVFVEVNNQRRVEPGHCEAAHILGRGSMGNIQAVSAYYVKGLLHNGSTVVDTLRMFLGEVSWVMAVPPYQTGSYGMDHSVDFLVGFRSGGKAMVQSCDKETYNYSIFELDMLFSGGRLTLRDNGFEIVQQLPKEYPHFRGFRSLGVPKLVRGDMAHAITYIYRAVASAVREGRIGFGKYARESVIDMAVVEAVRTSAQQGGKRIEL